MKKAERGKAIFVATVCIAGAIVICSIPYFFHLFLNEPFCHFGGIFARQISQRARLSKNLSS